MKAGSLLQTLRTQWLVILAVAGTTLAIVTATRNDARTPTASDARGSRSSGASAPVDAGDVIAGPGIVESVQRDVLVAAPASGVVTEVFVTVGAKVKAGAPLFSLDRRSTLADIRTREAAVRGARAKLSELRASRDLAASQLSAAESLEDTRAISGEELTSRRANLAVAQARIDAANADVQSREADLAAAKVADDLRVARVPSDGEVLAIAVRPGEFASPGSGDAPVRLGAVDRLQVRVDIDENDAWRFRPGGTARLVLRGNASLTADLTYEFTEKYVRPKTSLTGGATERVDTRVLQIIYSFPVGALPLYVGQQVDVVINVPPATQAAR